MEYVSSLNEDNRKHGGRNQIIRVKINVLLYAKSKQIRSIEIVSRYLNKQVVKGIARQKLRWVVLSIDRPSFNIEPWIFYI